MKECQDFCEQRVYVSELANSQCEASELQMSSKIVLGVSLRLTEVSSFGTLRFSAFRNPEKDDPAVSLQIYSYIFKDIASPFFNHKQGNRISC